MLSDEYIAGFFDADGSAQLNASIHNRGVLRFDPDIKFSQKEPEILGKIKKELNIGRLVLNGSNGVSQLQISNIPDMKEFVDRFIDKLKLKKKQLKILKHFLHDISHRRGIARTAEEQVMAMNMVYKMREENNNHSCPYKRSNKELWHQLQSRLIQSMTTNKYIRKSFED